MKNRKVVLVGDGAVGSSFAFSILQSTTAIDELVIIDLNKEKSAGDAKDLQDIIPFGSDVDVHIGDYSEAGDAGIVVITAGVPRKPGETRLDLVNKNAKILKTIVDPVVKSGFEGIFVVSANPVDILTTLTQKLSGFPKERVIGTGTSLDKARLGMILSQRFNYKPSEIDALVLGEHGDTSFINFDEVKVNGKLLKEITNLDEAAKTQLEAEVRGRGGEIIKSKGATHYGVARCLAVICTAILENRNRMMVLSAPMNGEYGINHDLYLGSPVVVNASGIAYVVETPLSDQELKKMAHSADQLQKVLDAVEL
ncbi:L-lactate dehydrogenase [Limosilactobacillus gorillae]|uniref:L-lactate dehydrogenase n=1 Tax=Limosilactobacillus gorillae TaxID=1450649 RepID=UPI000AD853D7|nr:L-lactate dehydrogenase [Limosilactobacillus gorillae]